MEELQPQDIEDLLQELEEEEAETELRAEAGSLSPSDGASHHLEQAFALEDEDEYEKALEECDTAIRLDPTLADAHNLRGVILEELGRNGEAIQAYREALRLDPGYAAAHENLRAAEAELDEYRIGPGSRSLRCRGMVENLRRCPNSASFRCAECGDALCRTHARLFLSPDAGFEQDEDSGVYCPFHYQTVVDRANLQAVGAELRVFFEAKDQTSHHAWQLAGVDLNPVAGEFTIHGYPYGEPEITVPVSEIASCEMVEREDITRNLTRTLEAGGCGGSGDWADLLLIPLMLLTYAFLEVMDRTLARSTKVPVLKLTQSPSDGSSQGWVIHLRSKNRGRRGQVETLEMAGHVAAFLRQTGYRGTMPEELGGPSEDPGVSVRESSLPADLEGSVKEEGVQAGFETAPQPLDWRFWLDFVGAGLLGGLTAGGLGGFAAGFLPMLGLSGVLGGAVGGLGAGGIHWLGLRRYVSVTWRWVFVCGVVGAVTWGLASGWAAVDLGSLDPVAFERDGVWAFVAVGIMAGILGGAVSGIAQAQILRQRILGVARWWIVVNTVGWAVGGAIFLPTFFAWAIGLIGGGNPGAAAAADIRTNEAICRPVCLPLLVVVPIWALIQGIRQRISQ